MSTSEFRFNEAGGICCCGFDAHGKPTPPVPSSMCDKCKAHFAVASASTFEQELGRRVGAAVTVTAMNANLGTGTYQVVASHGHAISKPFTFSGSTILTPTFGAPQNAGGPNKGQLSAPTPSPDGYTKALEERRAAEAGSGTLVTTKPDTHDERARQEADYRALREAEFAGEAGRIATLRAANGIAEPTMRHADAHGEYASPDTYGADLRALRERDARALAAKESR